MFISLIVPAYNVSQYIARCLRTLVNQDIDKSKYEIIVINDGSTDNTLDIINDLLKEFDGLNVRIIDQNNGGLSCARNNGFDLAQGDYVWFIDSDDYLQENCLKDISMTLLNNPNIDVLLFDMDYIYDDKPTAYNPRRLLSGHSMLGSELFMTDYRYPYSGVQFSIYKRQYLIDHNLKFKQGIFFEDILYTTLLLASNPKCIYINEVYYHYYIRKGSITNSTSSIKKCKDILDISDELYNLHESNNLYNKTVLMDQISRILSTVYRYHMKGLDISSRLKVMTLINDRNYWIKSVLATKKYKYIPYILLNLAFKPFSFLKNL